MVRQAQKAWLRACLSAGKTVQNAIESPANMTKSGFLKNRISVSIALLIATTSLSGCVGSTVNNALDVAVITPPSEQLLLEETAQDSNTQFAQAETGSVPVPVRSPLSANTLSTSEAALLPEEEKSPVSLAAAAVLNKPVASPSQAIAPEAVVAGTQTASLETPAPQITQAAPQLAETALNPASVPSPSVVQQPEAKTEKPKTLFELWFGKKSANAAKVPKKTIQPESKTVVASATPSTSSSLTSGLPGVQRNSAIFGVNVDESEDEDSTVQVASVGSLGRIMSPKGLILQTERVQVDCFKPELMQILSIVERKYGKKVIVTSGYRSPKGNRRAGGARNSTHIYCKAADIQIAGVSKWDLAKFLRSVPGRGGVGTYCRTESVHIDVGSQRDWHHPCRRSKKKKSA